MRPHVTEDVAFRLVVIKAKQTFVGVLEDIQLPITTMKVGWIIRRRQYEGKITDIKNLELDTGMTKTRVLDHIQALIDAGINIEKQRVGRNTFVSFAGDESEKCSLYFERLRTLVDDLIREMAAAGLLDWVADIVEERKKRSDAPPAAVVQAKTRFFASPRQVAARVIPLAAALWMSGWLLFDTDKIEDVQRWADTVRDLIEDPAEQFFDAPDHRARDTTVRFAQAEKLPGRV